MTRLKNVAVLALLAGSVLMSAPSRAGAGFLSDFTGNTLMRDTPSRSAVVSFTVFQTSGGNANWVAELNTALAAMGSAPVTATFLPGGGADTTAAYVYLYEMVNVSTANGQIDAFKVSTRFGTYTSAGYFSDRVFQDSQGAVEGSAGNNNYALGTNGPINSGNDDVVDGKPSFKNQTLTGVAGPLTGTEAINTIDPTSSDLAAGGDGTSPPYGPFVTFVFGPKVHGPQWTSIVFLTSDLPPTYWAGRATDGNYSDGDVPVSVTPEPGTLVMGLIGLVGLAGSCGWRRWRSRPVVSPA